MAIDVGGEFGSLSASSYGYTYPWAYNPCNASGVLNTVGVTCPTPAATGFKAGTVYSPTTAPSFKFRDYETIGDTVVGDNTFTDLNIDCVTGDYIGFYNSGGNIYYTYHWIKLSGYDNAWYSEGDQIDGGTDTYKAFSEYYKFSLFATGTETAAGQPFIKRFGGVPYAALNRGVF